jgi:hypothetical protein
VRSCRPDPDRRQHRRNLDRPDRAHPGRGHHAQQLSGLCCRPDPARYEERYRLTGAALGLASALLALGLGCLWHTQLIFAALTVPLAIPAVLAIACRPVAFRADHAGITLGSDRQLPCRPAVFISWAGQPSEAEAAVGGDEPVAGPEAYHNPAAV